MVFFLYREWKKMVCKNFPMYFLSLGSYYLNILSIFSLAYQEETLMSTIHASPSNLMWPKKSFLRFLCVGSEGWKISRDKISGKKKCKWSSIRFGWFAKKLQKHKLKQLLISKIYYCVELMQYISNYWCMFLTYFNIFRITYI